MIWMVRGDGTIKLPAAAGASVVVDRETGIATNTALPLLGKSPVNVMWPRLLIFGDRTKARDCPRTISPARATLTVVPLSNRNAPKLAVVWAMKTTWPEALIEGESAERKVPPSGDGSPGPTILVKVPLRNTKMPW